MTSYCSFIPETVWIREVENGIRHITLRRNFIEETITHQDLEEPQLQYQFEEADVFIPDRDNLQDFINANFDNLFEIGLKQMVDDQITEDKIQTAKQMIDTGTIVDNIQILGQQVTNILLGI